MSRTWKFIRGMMDFENIDKFNGNHVYSLAWRFTDDANDPWTKRLNYFKNGDPEAIKAACYVLSRAVSKLKWPGEKYVLITAIPHDKVSLPEDSGIFRLGEAVSSAVKWDWKPHILRKRKHNSLRSAISASGRDAEIANKYRATDNIEASHIVILDDFVTRGTTMAEISRAVKKVNKTAILMGLVLGKTDKRYLSQPRWYNLNNNHIFKEYEKKWDTICKG